MFLIQKVKANAIKCKLVEGMLHMCPTLTVHGTVMEEVTEETYLGDIISADGKNSKNINNRISKGLGGKIQIMNMLELISFGPYFFEIALLLRESILINSNLRNIEVWYQE